MFISPWRILGENYSFLGEEECILWNGFVKQLGFEAGVSEWGVMDDESGESTEEDDAGGVETG